MGSSHVYVCSFFRCTIFTTHFMMCTHNYIYPLFHCIM
jgi:hypothetical protein